MKTLKYFLSVLIVIVAVLGCNEDEFGNTDFVNNIKSPENVTAVFVIAQDNSGMVTIIPTGEGALNYEISLGDDTTEVVNVSQGESTTHIYKEGTYDVSIVAIGATGLKTEVTESLVISLDAPENLIAVIENDATVSKQVNVTVTADSATMFEVYFGEDGIEEPVIAKIEETASYTYAQPGMYVIRVVAIGGAIETTEYTEEFEVKEILQPTEKATTPPARNEEDVVSIYSNEYTNITVNEWNPGWGQSTVLSSIDIDGDTILKYDLLNFTGIVTDYDNPTNLSNMEFVHFDYWTSNAESIGFKIVNTGEPDGASKESDVTITDITTGTWVSVDIPLTDFTTNLAGVTQLLFIANGETVFVDNLYFWRN